MKQIDRFLIGIVAGIVALVVVALGVALSRPAPSFLAEETPGGVAFNYVLALKQRDDARAYGYLASDLKGYPPSLDEFSADMDRYQWSFNRESTTLRLGEERVTGERAAVTIDETVFSQGGLFGSGQYTSSFQITLRQQGGAWKIISADNYWAGCWNTARPCE